MKRATSSYKMSKAGKTYLAFNWNRPGKNALKRTVIESELAASENYRPKGKRETN